MNLASSGGRSKLTYTAFVSIEGLSGQASLLSFAHLALGVS